MDLGEQLTFWTARLAMFVYLIGLAVRFYPNRFSFTRAVWTTGCAILLLHLVCAFQFAHHWSHADAYAATARRTGEFIGVDWGGGLYFNYAFALIWIADVLWSWLAGHSHESRSAVIDWVVHGFLFFMAFNATVVFATGFTRWLFLAGCLVLGGLWAWARPGFGLDRKSRL